MFQILFKGQVEECPWRTASCSPVSSIAHVFCLNTQFSSTYKPFGGQFWAICSRGSWETEKSGVEAWWYF